MVVLRTSFRVIRKDLWLLNITASIEKDDLLPMRRIVFLVRYCSALKLLFQLCFFKYNNAADKLEDDQNNHHAEQHDVKHP